MPETGRILDVWLVGEDMTTRIRYPLDSLPIYLYLKLWLCLSSWAYNYARCIKGEVIDPWALRQWISKEKITEIYRENTKQIYETGLAATKIRLS